MRCGARWNDFESRGDGARQAIAAMPLIEQSVECDQGVEQLPRREWSRLLADDPLRRQLF